MKKSSRVEVDVLVVHAGSTAGHIRSERALSQALESLGYTFAEVVPDYRRVRFLQFCHPLLDLSQAFAISSAVRRALDGVHPRAIIYPTSLSTVLEPARRLRIAAVRYDALADENRLGARNVPLRLLERRSLPLCPVRLPFGTLGGRNERYLAPLTVPLPTPVDIPPSAPQKSYRVLCYAGNPVKKGLDVALQAWRQSGLCRSWELYVTGIDATLARSWLRERGMVEPPGIVWRGVVGPTEHRKLSASAMIVLSASRHEEFGIAQLEALADGAILVTSPARGAFEALHLAYQLDEKTVAEDLSGEALARSLRHAAALTSDAIRAYQAKAELLLTGYSSEYFQATLQSEVLPTLLGSDPGGRR